jgi:hypothetical protein
MWNTILAAGLDNKYPSCSEMLLGHFIDFAASFHNSLTPIMDYSDLSITEVRNAFAAVHLWILWALDEAQLSDVNQVVERSPLVIWNELWPPLEHIIIQSFVDRNLPDYVLVS